MRESRRSRGLMAAVGLLVAVAVGVAPSSGWAEESARGDAVRSLVTELMEVSGVPGLSLAILEDGEIVFADGFGLANIESGRPVTSETVFRAASVSKTLAVTLLARLVQKDLIGLDQEISEIGVQFPDAEGITPRLLSGHLAGIGHYQASDTIDRRRFYESPEEMLAVFSGGERAGEPGGHYQYSTHGYTLLQVAMSTAARTPFLELLAKEVFGPLEMTSSGGDLRAEPHPEMSTLYRMVGRNPFPIPVPEDPSYKWAGGGLVSTPTDLLKMARAYLRANDESYLDSEIVETWWTSQRVGEEPTGVGIGWRVGEDSDGRRIVHHAGSMGGARSVIYLVPDESRAIAIMCNAQWSSLIESTAKVLLDVWTTASADRPGTVKGDGPRRWRYSGTFGDAAVAGDLEMSVRGGSMSVPDAINERLRQAEVERFPIRLLSDSRWAVVSPIGLLEASLTGIASGEADTRLAFAWGSRQFEVALEPAAAVGD